MAGPAAIVARVVEERIARGYSSGDEEKYLHPSSLAPGCMQLVAREVMGLPKRELEPRVKRILEVGRDSHRRIESYLRGISLAREVFFKDEGYRIRGYCDDLIYIPPELSEEHSGFYAVEIKTAGDAAFKRIVDEGAPREDHLRQCMIYIWGVERYYGLEVRGGIIFYEDRDTLEHKLFDVRYDEEGMKEFLSQVEGMWEALSSGQLPEAHLPLDHWYHRYCPYLDICPVGQEAIRWQREHKKELPDEVLARIIGERIVRKRRKEKKGTGKERSLLELAEELGWS